MKTKRTTWVFVFLGIFSLAIGTIITFYPEKPTMPKKLIAEHVNVDFYHKITLGKNALSKEEALQMFGKPTTMEKQFRFFQYEEVYTWDTKPVSHDGFRISITFVGDKAYTKAFHNDQKVHEIMAMDSTMKPTFSLKEYQSIKVGHFDTGKNGMTKQEVFALLGNQEPSRTSASDLEEELD